MLLFLEYNSGMYEMHVGLWVLPNIWTVRVFGNFPEIA